MIPRDALIILRGVSWGEFVLKKKIFQIASRRSWWVIIRGFRLASWDWPVTTAPFPDPPPLLWGAPPHASQFFPCLGGLGCQVGPRSGRTKSVFEPRCFSGALYPRACPLARAIAPTKGTSAPLRLVSRRCLRVAEGGGGGGVPGSNTRPSVLFTPLASPWGPTVAHATCAATTPLCTVGRSFSGKLDGGGGVPLAKLRSHDPKPRFG